MIPVGQLAVYPSPTTAQAPVASSFVPPQAVIGRMPVMQVSPSVAEPELRNDSRNTQLYVSSEPAAASTLSSSILPMSSGIVPRGGISSFPTLFLAQLLGQGVDGETQSLAISYETMLQFSQVKYKPSDATVPPPPQSPMSDYMKSFGSANTAPPPPTANNNQPAPQPPAAQTQAKDATVTTTVVQLTAPAPVKAFVRIKSLVVTPVGSHAYAATSTRNSVHLEKKSDQLVVL